MIKRENTHHTTVHLVYHRVAQRLARPNVPVLREKSSFHCVIVCGIVLLTFMLTVTFMVMQVYM